MTSNKINLKLFQVSQNQNVFYIGKMKAKDLLKISTLHWRDSGESKENKYIHEVKEKLNVLTSDTGIQRVLQYNRLKEIADYISGQDGILPNSIIVSINNKWVDDEINDNFEMDGYEISENNDIISLTLSPDKIDAFIVDGQHRLASFGFTENDKISDDFEIVVTIFINLEIPLQAEIFSIINGKQKPVNKSLLYDLSSFNQDKYNEIKRSHSIVKWLNSNPISPFFNEIRMLGSGPGSISQSAFIDELLRYIKDRRAHTYKSFLKDKDEKEIIKLLLSYYLAIKQTFKDEWDDRKNYVFLKTTGFGALMKLLYYVYIKFCVENRQFNREELKEFFRNIKSDEFSVDKLGKAGSQGLQSELYRKLRTTLIGDENFIKTLEGEYRELSNN
ncbi:DGQHR domain-containing protein [Peribacillus sp. FSL P2-0133]|uniref:DGQHR domain-containing protein n=1 Tax=Peribacillus sp. FSL P2-0133 TaxID=2921573 RepID=UPI0030CFA1E0